ncbi:GNAT family N-acetyltransferase [Streptococcus ictaluri]|uniref:FR47-like protein n=1 Tax=Streptococcus ictaluri 707-05 TaxID=764299 RepID=G5K112_9STRE|nr:GNAT family N-acetyltransferase [Streptococcus ictaluri]EHI70435.1 FR47-like protein [Streptococcus ictaluri 707-05]
MKELIIGNQAFQRAASLYIRYSVFVLEKHIKRDEEFDDKDVSDTCYAVLYDHSEPVSTARFLPEIATEARITRVATLSKHRGKGYGAQIIRAMEKYAQKEGYHVLVIHSELSAKSFYETLGYKAKGQVYLEDGQACQTLEKHIGDS